MKREDSPRGGGPSNEARRDDTEAVAAALGDGRPAGESRELVGDSRGMRALRHWVDRVAPSELPVLIQGETGCGKEGVARRLHRGSRRSGGPFVAINCGALSESLLESELFGARRGAFTGADRDRAGLFRQAHGGTLFLDEVGDMPLGMQIKLLRALETRTVRPVGSNEELRADARIVAATHRELPERVAAGAFRADLFFRLAVLEVRVPALRHRPEDLPALIRSLTPRLLRETGLPGLTLSDCAIEALGCHLWPGNVRELHAVLARALLRAGSAPVRAADLGPLAAHGATADDSLERRMVRGALREASGSIRRAAQLIGWTRQKLYRRMAALGVEALEFQSPGTRSSESSTFQ